ncbi:MAG: type II toxin-antitoxin system HipA family toxin [Desulfovibrionaceae bacterium]|nr:type II toxin-antitoxin system HipA family toxin [Desulfovibrionaceae bacterium]
MSDAYASYRKRSCGLKLNGHYLGKLEKLGKTFRFSYSDEWLNSGFSLCRSMPLTQKVFESEKLPSIFLDASPDAWGKRILQKAEFLSAMLAKRNPVTLDDFDIFFRADDATRMGAIQLTGFDTTEVLSFRTYEDGISDIDRQVKLCYNFENISDLNKNAKIIVDIMRRGVSSGGARPKFNVRIAEELWLCKCGSSEDMFHEPGWEAVNLSLAKLIGLNVPEFHYDPSLNLLYIKRFDRKGEKRIHYASARTLLDADEGSYIEIATLCEKKSRIEIFKRMVFNALVGNYDDHLRNHGFLFDGEKWQLSPLFDVQCILIEKEASFHATILPDGNAFSNVRSLLSHPASFGLSDDEAEKVLIDMHRIVHKNVQQFAEQYGLTEEFQLLKSCYSKLDEDILDYV